jgi:hypothetical protein
MNVARQALLYDGLTSVAQRVYEATPIKEYWSANQVLQELHRQGRSMTLNEVTGCLNSLKNRKLVRETKAGFCRTHVIEKDAAPVAPLKVSSRLSRLPLSHWKCRRKWSRPPRRLRLTAWPPSPRASLV